MTTSKRVQALIAALIITGLVACGMLTIGVNALSNTNTVPVQNAPGAQAQPVNVSATSGGSAGSAAQLQQENAQLQDQLNQANAQLGQDQEIIQQLEAVLNALQQRGLISISPDGHVFINPGG